MTNKLVLKIGATVSLVISLILFYLSVIYDINIDVSGSFDLIIIISFVIVVLFLIVFVWAFSDKYPMLPAIFVAFHFALCGTGLFAFSPAKNTLIFLVFLVSFITFGICLINIVLNYKLNIIALIFINMMAIFNLVVAIYSYFVSYEIVISIFLLAYIFIGYSLAFVFLITAPKKDCFKELIKLKEKFDNKKMDESKYLKRKAKLLKQI